MMLLSMAIPLLAGVVGLLAAKLKVILPTAPGVSNEGGSSTLLVPLPAVSWPWVPAWGSLAPSRRGGENAPKMGKNGGKMAEIWSKTCEQGRDRRDQLDGPTLAIFSSAHAHLFLRRLRTPDLATDRQRRAAGRPRRAAGERASGERCDPAGGGPSGGAKEPRTAAAGRRMGPDVTVQMYVVVLLL